MTRATHEVGFRGIVHAHSIHSFDGSCGYAELRDLFGSAGLQFACMTEHIEQLDQSRIDEIIQDCRRHSDDGFVFIPGIEMDCFVVYFLGIASTTRVDFQDNRSIYASLRKHAELLVLSHPIRARYSYPEWILRDCNAVEIMNVKHDGGFYFRPQSVRLLNSIRETRPQVQALIGMDFHHARQMCSFHIRLTRTGPLCERFVLEQLKQGHVSFLKGDTALSEFSAAARAMLRARIAAMDIAHNVNRSMASGGLQLPASVRRWFRLMIEGR